MILLATQDAAEEVLDAPDDAGGAGGGQGRRREGGDARHCRQEHPSMTMIFHSYCSCTLLYVNLYCENYKI